MGTKVELCDFGDAVLLDVCSGFTVLDVTITRVGARLIGSPIVVAGDAVLAGLRSELMRRWLLEPGPPGGIEMPRFSRFDREQVREAFRTAEKYFEQRADFSSGDAKEFTVGSLRLARAIVAAVSEADISSQAGMLN